MKFNMLGDANHAGPVRLSDVYSSAVGSAKDGVAASQRALYDAYNSLNSSNVLRWAYNQFNNHYNQANSDWNTITESGSYLSTSGSNRPIDGWVLLFVSRGYYDGNGQVLFQLAISASNPTKIFVRTLNAKIWGLWKYIDLK